MPVAKKKKRKKKKTAGSGASSVSRLTEKQVMGYNRVRFKLPSGWLRNDVDIGGIRYGVVNSSWSFDDEVREAAAKGELLVCDSEIPVIWRLAPDRVEDVPYGVRPFANDPVHKWIEQKYQEALQRAEESDSLVHKLFSLPVADGYSYYVVIQEGPIMHTVEWRGYGGGDRYTDAVLGWGGAFPCERIEKLVASEESMNKLFDGTDKPV